MDKFELECAIELVEENGPLLNFSKMCELVAQALNLNYTGYEVKLAIVDYNLKTKTKISSPYTNKFEYIYTPSGKCPFLLISTDRTSVVQWMKKLFDYGKTKKTKYMPNAYRYYAAEFFDRNSRELKTVNQIIDDEYVKINH